MTDADRLLAPLLDHLDRHDPGGTAGVYLSGSAGAGGLRPDSDVDLLMLTHRSLDDVERAGLVELLLGLSGWRGHAARFPDAAHRRPVELTGVVLADVATGIDREVRDVQYGEWLRGDLLAGRLPQPTEDPDVVTLLATARQAHRVLRGPAFGELVAPVPADRLRLAVLAVIDDILEEIEGDERNTLLTLARIVITVESGRIVAKDEAAETVAPTLRADDRALLERARDGYRGTVRDDWAGQIAEVTALAHALARRARAAA